MNFKEKILLRYSINALSAERGGFTSYSYITLCKWKRDGFLLPSGSKGKYLTYSIDDVLQAERRSLKYDEEKRMTMKNIINGIFNKPSKRRTKCA